MKNTLSKKIRKFLNTFFTCLFLIFLALPQPADASNIYSADISYTCGGLNTYNFTVTLYRDCRADGAPNNVTLEFRSDSCGSSFNSSLSKDLLNVKEDSLVCNNSVTSSTCNGGSLWGIEEHYYTGSVVFPSQCSDWNISLEHFSRHDSITTIRNISNVGMQIDNRINNTIPAPCNNASSFSYMPIMRACAGQDFCYNVGAYDDDGDSLVVHLIPPEDTTGEAVPFKQGYDFNNPISTSSSFSFDPQTQELCFTPDTPQIGVIAFEVSAYRNDTLVSKAMREVYMIVDSCSSNTPPKIDTPHIDNISNGVIVSDKLVETCPGSSLSFDIPATDADGDNILMTANNNQRINGSSFSTSCSNCANPVGTFSWTPSSVGEYSFSVRLEDDHCDYPGYYFRTITIRVINGTKANAERTSYCTSGDSIQLYAQGGNVFAWTPTNGLSCDSCPNPKAAPTTPTTYTVTSNFVCNNVDSIAIDTVPNFNVTAGPDTFLCNEGDSVPLNTNVSSPTPNSYSYEWTPRVGLSNPNVPNPNASPPFTINYRVAVTSDSGCVVNESVKVDVSSVPEVVASSDKDFMCKGDTARLKSHALGTFPILEDDFNNGIDNTEWVSYNLVQANTNCGASNKALWFGGGSVNNTANRYIESRSIDLSQGGRVKEAILNFFLLAGDCSYTEACGSTCEDPDGEDMNLQLSDDGGSTWQTCPGCSFDGYNYDDGYFKAVTVNIPDQYIGNNNVKIRFKEDNFTYNLTTSQNNWMIDNVQLNVKKVDTAATYNWTPTASVIAPTKDTTDATPVEPTNYTVTASSFGCTASENVFVGVDTTEMTITMTPDTGILCRGDTVQLGASLTGSQIGGIIDDSLCALVNDDFDPIDSSLWSFNSAVVNQSCGSLSGDALKFCGSTRRAETKGINVADGGKIKFGLFIKDGFSSGSCSSGCDEVDGNYESVVLEYSTDGGSTWNLIKDFQYNNYDPWAIVTESIPPAAQTANTMFRWRQKSFGTSLDHWAIDDVQIFTNCEFNWSPAVAISDTTSKTVDVYPSTNTTYIATLNNYGCNYSDSILVKVAGPIVTADTIEPTTCGQNNGVITVDVQGDSLPFSYNWNDSTLPNNNTVTGLAPITYTVTVTGGSGCKTAKSFTVDSIRQPDVQIQSVNDASCFNTADGAADIKMRYGSPPFDYQWSTGDTSEDLNNVLASTYYVTVTDNENCIVEHKVKIAQPDPINIYSSTKPVSSAGAGDGMAWVNVSGGTFPYSYEWSDGQQDDTARNLSTGNYTITVTDNNGCTAMKTVEITTGTGLKESDAKSLFTLYPNPNQGEFTVELNASGQTDIKLTVYNTIGEKVYTYKQNARQQLVKTIRLTNQPSGVYFMKAVIGDAVYVRKVMIER